MITRIEYDAYLHYLIERENKRKIIWDATVFERYLEWHNSNREVSIDLQVESNRRNSARKASRYAILEARGKQILGKLDKTGEVSQGKAVFQNKRVVCDEEFDALLNEYHDQKNHLGYVKCYYEVNHIHINATYLRCCCVVFFFVN